MKKIILPFIIIVTISYACTNTDKKPGKEDGPANMADSLIKVIDDGHHEGMGKIGRLHNTRNAVQHVIDSIGKLPAKAQEAAASFIEQLKSAVKDLNDANGLMESWMTEYDQDSARDDEAKRIEYLEGEKSKIERMKEAIRNSLAKADSLLKAKF